MISAAVHRDVLLDTGPLVALLNPRDSEHGRCVAAARTIFQPMITSWAVLTEAAWLLRAEPASLEQLFRCEAEGVLEVARLEAAELSELAAIRERYLDLSPQLADLTLVHLAERDGHHKVFTLDRRDFHVYRIHGKQAFHLLPEVAD